jgi:tRNA dimethylallyltransferase
VPEIAAFLRKEIPREEAARRAILATHQYTKRQMTWFRHQKLTDSTAMQIIQSRIDSYTQFSERDFAVFDNLIKHSS